VRHDVAVKGEYKILLGEICRNIVYSPNIQYTALGGKSTVQTLYTEKIQSEYNDESTISGVENGLAYEFAGFDYAKCKWSSFFRLTTGK
jgi:hypothetical protein